MTAGDEVLLYKNIYMYIYSYSPWAFFQDYMYTYCQDENKEKFERKGRIASYM